MDLEQTMDLCFDVDPPFARPFKGKSPCLTGICKNPSRIIFVDTVTVWLKNIDGVLTQIPQYREIIDRYDMPLLKRGAFEFSRNDAGDIVGQGFSNGLFNWQYDHKPLPLT